MSADERESRVKSLGKALDLGREMLADGRPALDVVEKVIRLLEDDPQFNAGRGAVLNSAGGHELDASLMDTSLAWVSYHLMGYMATGDVPGPMGSSLGSIAPYRAFRTLDGHVMIAAGNDGIFRRLCAALDLPEVAEDPRFASMIMGVNILGQQAARAVDLGRIDDLG